MLLLTPPADLTEAVSPVAVNVCTRDKAASNCVQADGFLLVATTRNSIGAFCAIAWVESIPANDTAEQEVQNIRIAVETPLLARCTNEV
jgi:hypothetical protein